MGGFSVKVFWNGLHYHCKGLGLIFCVCCERRSKHVSSRCQGLKVMQYIGCFKYFQIHMDLPRKLAFISNQSESLTTVLSTSTSKRAVVPVLYVQRPQYLNDCSPAKHMAPRAPGLECGEEPISNKAYCVGNRREALPQFLDAIYYSPIKTLRSALT